MTYQSREPVETVEPVEPVAPSGQVNVNSSGASVRGTSPMTVARRVVGLLFGVLIALIALRFLLLLLGANEGNALVDGIYGITEPFVGPFRGVFSIDQVRPTGNSVIDVGAIVAIVGWSLVAALVFAILRITDRA